MTETTENLSGEKAPVHWVAFFVALIAAPLIPAVLAYGLTALLEHFDLAPSGLPVLAGVILMAPAFGGLGYLVVGGPFLWHAARSKTGFAGAAFAANIASTPLVAIALFLLPGGSTDVGSMTGFIVGFGSIFAPLWGAIFGMLYPRLCNVRWLP